MTTNKHGLSRNIPGDVRLAVRQNSKFGCVICRSGIFTYEHILPKFTDATVHDANKICLLCGNCQLMSTKGTLSKETIERKYLEIRTAQADQVPAAHGPFDFGGDHPELHIGGFMYHNGLGCILKVNGVEVLKLNPRSAQSPPSLDGVFYDASGREQFRMDKSGWSSKPDNWDFRNESKRLVVYSAPKHVCLELVASPPKGVILSQLDMRIGEHHILCRNNAYAIGRHVHGDLFHWFYSGFYIIESGDQATAFEIVSSETIEERWAKLDRSKQHYVDPPGEMLFGTDFGVASKSIGVITASRCASFQFSSYAKGILPIDIVREVLKTDPRYLQYELSRGGSPRWYNLEKQREEFKGVTFTEDMLIDFSIIASPDLPHDR